MSEAFHLYVISFTVGKEAGLALVAAQDEKSAFQILKNGGSRYGEGYSLIQTRDIGMTANCHYGLLLESYVNALQAFDAITSVANYMRGPAGPVGPQGPQGEDGRQGIDGASLIDIQQTHIATEDGGQNEITFTLADETERKVYIKNGETGVQEATATVDAVHGVPQVTVYFNDGLLSFAFTGLKGMQGNPGVNNATMVLVDELPTASADTIQNVYLIYNDQTGDYDRYFTQYDGEEYSWVQAGSLTVNLADYRRKDDDIWLTQAEFDALEVKDITKVYNIYEESDEP